MARDGHKRAHSKDATATARASRRSPSPTHNGCPELSIRRGLKTEEGEDKSEELSDIINFLIETDPRRSRDEYGAIYASSDDAERVSSPASGKELASCELEPGTEEAPCQESTDRPPEPAVTSSSSTCIVLPAADIYGFNYQPDFAPSSPAPGASSQTLQSAHVERNNVRNWPLLRAPRDAEMSATDSLTDRVGPLVNGNGRCSDVDLCQVPSGDAEIREKTSQSPVNNAVTAAAEKSDIANKGCGPSAGLIIKPADISQDADDSLADEVARGPAAIENCDDGRADSGAALDSSVYQDTRPCCAKEDSRAGGSRRDGGDHNCDAPGECQLRTPAASATTVCDSGATSGQPVETAGGTSETDRETSSPPSGTSTSCNGGGVDAVPALEDSVSACEPKELFTKCNESGAESDGTEALEWSPGRVSRSNSADYARDPSSAAVACDDVCGNTDVSAAGAGAQPTPSTFPEGDNAPLVNGGDVPECASQSTDGLAPLTDCKAPDRGLDNLISVFTTVEQGKILRVDCKKFRKRGRPPGPKRLLAMRRAQRAAMETSSLLAASETEDVEFTVRQVLRDVVDRIVSTSCEVPSKLSEANIKEVITTFCESNGIRCQDFTGGDNDDISFGNVLPEERGRRRRIGSSDHGSSSDRGSPVAAEVTSDNGTPRKRYRKRQTVPAKRMLTRSQWRRSCYQKGQDSVSTDQPDNGLLVRDNADALPDAKRWRRSVDLTSESSNPESSADALSSAYGGASQDIDMGVATVEDASRGVSDDSRGPASGCASGDVGDSSCVLVAEKLSSAQVNNSIYLSSQPPKLGYMEASVTNAPRELTSIAAAVSGGPQDVSRDAVDASGASVVSVSGGGDGHCADYSKDRQRLSSYGCRDDIGRTNDGNDDDDDESRLMICDTDEPLHDAGVSGASSVGTVEGAELRALTKTKAGNDACSFVHAGLSDSRRAGGLPPAASPVRGAGSVRVCESEKAAADTGVVCLTEQNDDDAATHDATVAGGGTGGTSRALLKSPAAVHSVQGSPVQPGGSCDGPISAGVSAMSSTSLRPPPMGPRRAASSSPSRTSHMGGRGVSPHCPRPASLPTPPPVPTGSPDVIVVKEEPNDLSVARRAGGGTAGGALPTGLEPLDLTVKESSFRAKSDIPVGKVQPQMTTSTSQPAQEETMAAAATTSPINYSSSRQSTGQRVEDGGHSSKEREKRVSQASDSNSSRPHSGTGNAGTSSTEPLSDSILQRLLLDPSRKPKEVESKAASPPVPVIMDVRSLRGGITEGTPNDSSKRGRDTDIVTEAKSLLNARLTARHQEQQLQQQQLQQTPQSLVKASNMASVPPMSFPENKLGMSTLESKIVELKKQIHHLTILATYKEKELACISSLRTAKEDALKQLESKYPGICSIMRAFGPEASSGESSGDSPGFTDVPSIVAQAATATSGLSPLGAFASETDPPLHKKPAVQQPSPTLPVPLLSPAAPQRLRTNSGSERDSPGRGLLPYDRGSAAVSSATTMTSVSPRDSRQPGTAMITTAPSKSAFSVPTPSSSSLQGQRQPRLLLPKGAVPAPAPAPGSSAQAAAAAAASRVNAAGALPPGAAAVSSWWNAHNGTATALSLATSGLPHHLQREALRDYASSSSTAALLKAASVPSSAIKQHGTAAAGGTAVATLSKPEAASLAGASDVASRSAHRRLAETAQGRVEDARDLAAELARQQEEYNLALTSAGSLSGVNAGYPLSRAGLSAAASMYNQAMAYSLYQQLRMNKEAAAAQAETSALLEKMKHHNLPPSQQQHLYHKALLEQAKSRPTSWEHINHLLQKDGTPSMQAGVPLELLSLQPKLSATAPELLPWLQAGLACVNCGDPRVKFVCSCCRTQTFCSEQCQVKLWNKLKAQTPAKN